jgi:hypothetical protein
LTTTTTTAYTTGTDVDPAGKQTRLPDDVRAVLTDGHVDGDVFYLPAGELPADLADAVRLTLRRLGGKWSHDRRGYVFRQGDPGQLVTQLLLYGHIPARHEGTTLPWFDRLGVLISRMQLEEWAGRDLTDAEVSEIGRCIAHSSIPDAIGDIAASLGRDGWQRPA